MKKENYIYHFGYSAERPRFFKPIKAMVGSNNLLNIAWTAPALIGLNYYLLPKFGSLIMTKFFVLSLFTSFAFMSTFNPGSGLNFRPLYGWPVKCDSNDEKGRYFMGADQMAQSIIYFTLLYHRLWFVAAPLMLLDIMYYGPATAGGAASAILAASMFL